MKAFAEEFSAPSSTTASAAAPSTICIDDKRKYLARIPIELRLRITAVNYSGPGRSLDLSVTGMLIETSVPLILAERVILTITPPDHKTSFNICAEVVRLAGKTEQPEISRFGLRVLTDDSLTWQNFLRLLVLK